MMTKMRALVAGLAFAVLSVPVTVGAEMQGGKWQVRSGDSLSKIAGELAPDSAVKRKRLMQRILAANPKAFKDGNPNWLFAGATLMIPEADAEVPAVASRTRVTATTDAAEPAPYVQPQADGGAGMVTYTKGSVMAANQDGVRELSEGDSLFQGETLTTGPGSYLRMRYSDGATMLIRPRSRLVIEDYQHRGDPDTDRSFLRLVKGGFRTVTGVIGKDNRDAYRVSTPVATIGIRGTDYHTLFCQGDCINVPDGLYTTTDDGETVLTNNQGSQGVAAGKSGYVPIDGGRPVPLRVPPKVLKLPPPECS